MQSPSSPAFLLFAATLAGCATSNLTPTPQPVVGTPIGAAVAQNPPPRSTTTETGRVMDDGVTTRRAMPWEVMVGGAGSSNQDFDAGGGSASASVGYFLNDVVEIGVRQTMAYSDPAVSGGGVWNGASRAALDLHIPLGNFMPYVGANLGYVYGDSIHDSLVAGPEAGVKLFLKDDAFLAFGAEWEFFFDKSDRIEDAFQDGQLLYALSMGLRF